MSFKIALFKFLDLYSFFALGSFLIAIGTWVRLGYVQKNYVVASLIMFALVTLAICAGEYARSRKDILSNLEESKDYKFKVLKMLGFLPVTLVLVFV